MTEGSSDGTFGFLETNETGQKITLSDQIDPVHKQAKAHALELDHVCQRLLR